MPETREEIEARHRAEYDAEVERQRSALFAARPVIRTPQWWTDFHMRQLRERMAYR